ncbi:MAG: hypothetical protein GEU99_21245 [Luteitalea sp.]|nr:hypothetical protein [Luteitalea sp.]
MVDSSSLPLLLTALYIVCGGLLMLSLFIYIKGRPPVTEGHAFRASRLSSGNRLLPTQVIITPQSVVRYTPRWIGRHEHSIHMAHVASVRIDTKLLFSDVYIETTGGTSAIVCTGHTKGDARRMKALVEQYQSEYYKQQERPASATRV